MKLDTRHTLLLLQVVNLNGNRTRVLKCLRNILTIMRHQHHLMAILHLHNNNFMAHALLLHHLHHGTRVQARNLLYTITIMHLRSRSKILSHQGHLRPHPPQHSSIMHKLLHQMIIGVTAMQQ
jgi:hypothetical protein